MASRMKSAPSGGLCGKRGRGVAGPKKAGHWEGECDVATRIVTSDVVTLIDSIFPWAKDAANSPSQTSLKLDNFICSSLMTISRPAAEIPANLITLHGAPYAAYLASLDDIRDAVELQRAMNIQTGSFYAKHEQLGGMPAFKHRHPVEILRTLLVNCPDQFPVSFSDELKFLTPDETRTGMIADISAVHDAIAITNWKAAAVLGGAVVEALLLCAIQPLDWKSAASAAGRGDILRWDLSDLIGVAKELKIISEKTAAQATLSREARNLIHPGKMLRDRAECHRGTAFAAAAAIDHVVRDLEQAAAKGE